MGFLRGWSRPEHDPVVIYVYERKARLAYYSAVCRCGWFAEPVDEADYPNSDLEMRMATAARAHDPSAVTEVAFPLETPRPADLRPTRRFPFLSRP